MLKSPKVGPYGETYFNERTGKRDYRLTETGKQIVTDHMAKYPYSLAVPLRAYPRLARYIIMTEGRDSAECLADQGVIIAVAKWEPHRAALPTAIQWWTRNLFQHVAGAKKVDRPPNFVRLDWDYDGGDSASTMHSTIPDDSQPDPSIVSECLDESAFAWNHVGRMQRNYAEMIRLVYSDGLSLVRAGQQVGGYSAEFSRRLRNDALYELRWRMGVPQPKGD